LIHQTSVTAIKTKPLESLELVSNFSCDGESLRKLLETGAAEGLNSCWFQLEDGVHSDYSDSHSAPPGPLYLAVSAHSNPTRLIVSLYGHHLGHSHGCDGDTVTSAQREYYALAASDLRRLVDLSFNTTPAADAGEAGGNNEGGDVVVF
jgi:hypothetical protein